MTPPFADVAFEEIDTDQQSNQPAAAPQIGIWSNGVVFFNAAAVGRYLEATDSVALRAAEDAGRVILGVVPDADGRHARTLSDKNSGGEISVKCHLEALGICFEDFDEAPRFDLEPVDGDQDVVAAADVTDVVEIGSAAVEQPAPESEPRSPEAIADGSGAVADAPTADCETASPDEPVSPGDDSADEIFEEGVDDEADTPETGQRHWCPACGFGPSSEAGVNRHIGHKHDGDVEPVTDEPAVDGEDGDTDAGSDDDGADSDTDGVPEFFNESADPFVIIQENGVPERIGLDALLEAAESASGVNSLRRELNFDSPEEADPTLAALRDLGLLQADYKFVGKHVRRGRIDQIRRIAGLDRGETT